jgi:hypothetical protein
LKFLVLEHFKVRIPEGEMDIQPGQVVILTQDQALRLLNEGKITLFERVALKLWSEVLQSFLWVVYDEDDIEDLRNEISKDPIYAISEFRQLRGLTKDSLRKINQVKEIFPMSTIKEIKKDLKK